jgi:hypothetical protein
MFGGRKLRFLVALGSCVCAATGVVAQNSNSASSSRLSAVSCADYELIDVHGSGGDAYTNSPAGLKLKDELERLWSPKQVKVDTVPFNAAGGFYALLGAGLKQNRGYQKSVLKIKDWLRKQLITLSKDCPGTRIVLSGYSQGAQAVADIYQERPWAQIVGVALFGDPNYNHADSSDRFGLNFKPKSRIKTRLDGALAAPRPRKALDSSRVLSYCHQEDPICQASLTGYELLRYRMSQHNNYTKFGEPEQAAKYFAGLVKGANKPSPPVKSSSKWPTKRHDGPHGFFIWLGANLIDPNWVSCDASYCIVGSGATVYVFTLNPDYEQIGTIPVSSTDPQGALRGLGIPVADVQKLLSV